MVGVNNYISCLSIGFIYIIDCYHVFKFSSKNITALDILERDWGVGVNDESISYKGPPIIFINSVDFLFERVSLDNIYKVIVYEFTNFKNMSAHIQIGAVF